MYNNFRRHLNESYGANEGNADIIEKLGDVDVYDENTKSLIKYNASKIIKVCADAQYKIQRDYPYFKLFLDKCKVMYIPTYPSKITNTMAVDENNNLWINCSFVYNQCKMNSDRVFGILFHELFHIFLDHCMRFNEKYPAAMYKGMEGVLDKANSKANICMDYEVNTSMVDDGIVSADFWKRMKGLYKKEYVGKTWEELMDTVGDQEYKEWLERNGYSLDDIELKILEAVEKASKVLMDPTADEDEKRAARKQLQKTLDELLGKQDRGEKTLQDTLEDLQNTRLGDIGEIAKDIDDVIYDLYKDPKGMSSDELNKTLSDMDKLMNEMGENVEEIANQFGKDMKDTGDDINKAREALKDAMKKINEGNISNDEKEDLLDKAKDSLEDIIADDHTKDQLKKKREERDAKKAAARKERFKKNHPLRKLIVLMQNFLDLNAYGLICKTTQDILPKIIEELEPLTELTFSEMKKSMFKNLGDYFEELKDSFFQDLVALLKDETILNKTESDMQSLLDMSFDALVKAIRGIFDKSIPDEDKTSLINIAVQKLRMIGKVLKTQKVWRVGEDFKKAYMEEMKRLMQIFKDGGDEALFKELFDKGVINIFALDDNGMKLYEKITGEKVSATDIETGDEGDSDARYSHEPSRYTDDFTGADSEYEEEGIDIEPYEGKLYYSLWVNDNSETILELSDISDGLEDSNYERFGLKFEKDFPEYRVSELMESVFEVCYVDTFDFVDFDELKKKLEDHPDYKLGDWESTEK